MHITEVIKTDARYSRNAYLKFVDDKVVFDCSDDEYGPIEFNIKDLESALKRHQENKNYHSYVQSIRKYKKNESEESYI